MTIHFILPGYAPLPVGGYRVVYDYALEIQRSSAHEVVVHHSPSFMLSLRHPLSPKKLAGLVQREIARIRHTPRRKGVSWYPQTKDLDIRFSLSLPRIASSPRDIVVATAVQTAPYVAALDRSGAVGVFFIQHVETWSASTGSIDEAWRLPLYRIVIAPWLAEYGERLGVDSHLVVNAIDGADFPLGRPIAERERQVLSMLSPHSFKRADLILQVFAKLHDLDESIRIVAFGVNRAPDGLPSYVTYHQNPDRVMLARLYRESRVYLCASDAEGWHLPPGEALLSGTPIVSTDIGGVRVSADGAGLFSPVGDPVGLYENALRLLDDAVLGQHLADVGHRRLSAYGPQQAARAFLAALEQASA